MHRRIALTAFTCLLLLIASSSATTTQVPSARVQSALSADPAQNIITTIAGTGASMFTGDNEPATFANIGYPSDLVTDANGNIYVTDLSNSRVRKIDGTGIITTVAGNGVNGFGGDGVQATTTSLNQPFGIALDTSGNLFIADSSNNRIRKVSTNGIITTVAGTGTGGFSGDGGPGISAQLQSD